MEDSMTDKTMLAHPKGMGTKNNKALSTEIKDDRFKMLIVRLWNIYNGIDGENDTLTLAMDTMQLTDVSMLDGAHIDGKGSHPTERYDMINYQLLTRPEHRIEEHGNGRQTNYLTKEWIKFVRPYNFMGTR
jgi:hypothetical protein